MKRARRAPRPPALAVDVVVHSRLWNSRRGARTVVRQALAAAAATVSTTTGEVAIVLTDDSSIRALNREWRGKDQPTNVLSFSVKDPHRAPGLLGDIVIAYETTVREAEAERKPFSAHLAHLAVHGFLHLLGYDHERDQEADAMERLEVAALAKLKVPDPYRTRDSGR